MALSSTSTIDEIKAAYIDNSVYDVEGSVAKAKLFIQACRVLLLVMPKMAAQDRGSVSLSPELIQTQLTEAQQFISNAPPEATSGNASSSVRYFDTSNFRE